MNSNELRQHLARTVVAYIVRRRQRVPLEIHTVTTGRECLRACLDEIEDDMIHAIQKRLEQERHEHE